MGKFSAGRLNDFHYVILLVCNNNISVGFTPRLRCYSIEWYYFRLFCQVMADSTDEDATRFALSRDIGVIESERESLRGRGVGVDSDGESEEGGEASEGQLQIVEGSDGVCQGGVSVDTAAPVDGQLGEVSGAAPRRAAGFGEIDTGDSDDDDSDDAADAAQVGAVDASDDDDASIHSSGSDARHDLDYLHDQHGGFLSYLLMAS